MTETVVAQIIGMAAMLTAGVVGAWVTHRFHRHQRKEDRTEGRKGVRFIFLQGRRGVRLAFLISPRLRARKWG